MMMLMVICFGMPTPGLKLDLYLAIVAVMMVYLLSMLPTPGSVPVSVCYTLLGQSFPLKHWAP